MSMHCDQCDQGRRCTGACMEHYADQTPNETNIRASIVDGCFGALLVMFIFLFLHIL